MKFLKTIIIVIIIIVILLTIFVINIINKNNKEILTDFSSYENGAEVSGLNTELTEVKIPMTYYTVYECINNYFKLVSMNIEETSENEYIPGGEISYSDMMGIYSEKEKNQYIYNILDVNYIKDNNISLSNVEDYTGGIDSSIFEIERMYEINGERIRHYVVYTKFETGDKKNFLVVLDTDNYTYMVKPLNYIDYENLKKEDVYQDISEIKENVNNTFEYVEVSQERIAEKYFYNYKNLMFNNVEESYYKLNKEYREKRFKNLENYKEYIIENEEVLSTINIAKYLVNNNDTYVEYICKDQFENLYIFKTYAVMNYELELDTYTINTDKFKAEYTSANNQKKVQMNIDKFIKMINTYDYINAYDYITPEFRDNYFQTNQKFKDFCKQIFFSHNKIKYKDITEKGNNIYICNVELYDMMNEEAEFKNLNFIVQLINDTDFVISFGV